MCAYLCEELDAPSQHGVYSPSPGKVVLCLELSLAHSQSQQVAGRNVPLQQLLEEIIQCLQIQEED